MSNIIFRFVKRNKTQSNEKANLNLRIHNLRSKRNRVLQPQQTEVVHLFRNNTVQQSNRQRKHSAPMDLIILRNLGYNLQPTNIPKEWLLYDGNKYYKVFKATDLAEAVSKAEKLIKKRN